MKNLLPKKLQDLVFWSVSLLGRAIKEEYGEKAYQEIETLRMQMKKTRHLSDQKVYLQLKKSQSLLEKKSDKELYAIAHSYALMMELINSCEISYRAYRVSDNDQDDFTKTPYAIIYVMTAHPTEARSPEILQLFQLIQAELLDVLRKGKRGEREAHDKVLHYLKLAMHIPMARETKPTVADEAQNIYSVVLKEKILNEIIELKRKGVPVYFRAWVGGDKDGHPGVDEKTMVMSLNLSRQHLIKVVGQKLNETMELLSLVNHKGVKDKRLHLKIQQLQKMLLLMKTIKTADGRIVKRFYDKAKSLNVDYQKLFGIEAPGLKFIDDLLWIFPALVLPLEVREDSADVALALKDKKAPISRMLTTLRDIATGYESRWYVRGFVLSMVESEVDFMNGLKLARRCLGRMIVPVVPLFENEKALVNGVKILKETFARDGALKMSHQTFWNSRFEVMLGYSDSSKENGVFPSRYLISKAMFDLDRLLKSLDLTPVFFHGSGGSVERGGGSVREQTQWWPRSAVNVYKATIQGEMVARTFSHEDILRRQVEIITSQLTKPRVKKPDGPTDQVLHDFALKIKECYSQKVKDDDFWKVIEKATPYGFLSHLKIGSRPTKRSTGGQERKLRAIPWILCWTQTRTLFPTWWGIGSIFDEMTNDEKWRLKKAYENAPLLASFVKVLGFSLAKVELAVWRIYLESADLDPKLAQRTFAEFTAEYQKTLDFVKQMTGERSLLWFRPWLEESITYRSSMIHPLNLIQIEALRRKNLGLLRETVTGISCGMMTTG